jgi:hypothetical protein
MESGQTTSKAMSMVRPPPLAGLGVAELPDLWSFGGGSSGTQNVIPSSLIMIN